MSQYLSSNYLSGVCIFCSVTCGQTSSLMCDKLRQV